MLYTNNSTVLENSLHNTPSISSDGKPQLCKRHILTNSSIDATIQRWIAAHALAVLRFHRSLTKARLQSTLMEGVGLVVPFVG